VQTAAPSLSAESPSPTPADPVEELLESLTLEEKVGQLLVVGIEGTELGEDAAWALREARVGGIVLFGRNVESAEQLVGLTNRLKAENTARVPLLLCVDEEGGAVSRMPPEVADLPNAYDYAQAGGDPYARGEVLAAECAAFGFHVDFAPVLDVWSNPDNTVIGRRAFGTDPLEVAVSGPRCAYAMMEGGVVPVVKHFPGHGDTDTDSHVGLPVVDQTRQELEDNELMPFRFAVEGIGGESHEDPTPVPAVMVGHILMTELNPEKPASLSPAVVTDLLRGDMGFEGVVFTDDLTMGAVTNAYGVGEAAVLAVEAGCDVALVCHGWAAEREAYDALLEAAESGRISQARLDESVGRVLALKLDPAYDISGEAIEVPDVEALNETVRSILP